MLGNKYLIRNVFRKTMKVPYLWAKGLQADTRGDSVIEGGEGKKGVRNRERKG